jgi:hypothetical protein
MANKEKQTPSVEELKAQIEEQVRAEYEAKLQAEKESLTKAKDEVEEKAKAQEARMEKELARQEKTMKQRLDAEPKKTIFIPENPQNPNEVVPVGVNGVIYAIPVGQEFEVPESIYNVWKYSYEETRKANKKMDQVLTKEIKIL